MKRFIQSKAFVFAGITLILAFGVAILFVYARTQPDAPQSRATAKQNPIGLTNA